MLYAISYILSYLQVRKQLAMALSATAQDVGSLAQYLESLVASQARQVEALAVDVSLIAEKERLDRGLAAAGRLNAAKAPTPNS